MMTIINDEFSANLLALATMCAKEETDTCDVVVTTSRGKVNCHIEFSVIKSQESEE